MKMSGMKVEKKDSNTIKLTKGDGAELIIRADVITYISGPKDGGAVIEAYGGEEEYTVRESVDEIVKKMEE